MAEPCTRCGHAEDVHDDPGTPQMPKTIQTEGGGWRRAVTVIGPGPGGCSAPGCACPGVVLRG